MPESTPARVLVTGGGGQLAACLRKTQPQKVEVTYAAREVIDLTSAENLRAALREKPFEFIINAAAYTKVDLAEKEKSAAFAANEQAVQNLAEICAELGIYLIHVSTDFVFHGGFNRPIDETQMPNPIGVYAESKAAGEKALLNSAANAAIVRTAWLYSEFNANFMKTMLRLGKEKPRLTVIADQHGSPTYAADLASALWKMIDRLNGMEKPTGVSTYHFANYGVTTWYDFAKSILELAHVQTPIEPILTHEYPVATPRPAYSALWPRKFAQDFEFEIREWREALSEAIAAYKNLEGDQK